MSKTTRDEAIALARAASERAGTLYDFYGTKERIMQLWNETGTIRGKNPVLTMEDMETFVKDGTLVHIEGEDYHIASVWLISRRFLLENLEASLDVCRKKMSRVKPEEAAALQARIDEDERRVAFHKNKGLRLDSHEFQILTREPMLDNHPGVFPPNEIVKNPKGAMVPLYMFSTLAKAFNRRNEINLHKFFMN